MGGDPPVLVVAPSCFFQTPLICSKVLPTKVPSLFWNRCLTRNLTHPPHMFYKEVYDLKQKWPHTSWCFLPSGGPRHYDPGVYNQQREQLMAILPQSQQELPPRRWEISSNFQFAGLDVWMQILFSGWLTVLTLPSSHLAVMLCWETGLTILHFTKDFLFIWCIMWWILSGNIFA